MAALIDAAPPTLPRAALVFSAGMALGALLLSWAQPRATPAAPLAQAALLTVSADEASPVRGQSTPADEQTEPGARQHTAALEGSDLEGPPRESRATHSRREGERGAPPRPADIASQALGYTVYVAGGDVYGGGILLDAKGHLLTCDHVIEGLDTVEVSFAGAPPAQATVVARDAQLDLALLRIDGKHGAPAEVASVQTVQTGDTLFSMGAPRKMRFTLSRGMASYVGRVFDGVRYLQTDLPLNGGSSGGPVMNEQGQVVAMSSFVLKDSEGLAFALPIDYAFRRFARWLDPPANFESAGGPAFDDWLSTLGDAAPH